MAQGIDLELKDIVLSNSSFGPNEIDYVSVSYTHLTLPTNREV